MTDDQQMTTSELKAALNKAQHRIEELEEHDAMLTAARLKDIDRKGQLLARVDVLYYAMKEIVELDFEKIDGRVDFHSGPSKFISAWLRADDALRRSDEMARMAGDAPFEKSTAYEAEELTKGS